MVSPLIVQTLGRLKSTLIQATDTLELFGG
jgi:hypothetical protein